MTNSIKTAVILAAGMGTRLDGIGNWVPKGFLKLGDKFIIEESINRLQQVGIERIVIVTGHLKEFYTQLASDSNGLIETVYNEHYDNSGTMYSLYKAYDLVKEDFLLIESDLIYEQRALQAVLDFPKNNAVLLSGATHSGDEIFVETSNDILVNMSKSRSELGEQILGELVGICKISQSLFSVMVHEAKSSFTDTFHVNYEVDSLVKASSSSPVFCHLVSDLIWAEIDNSEHLDRATNLVYLDLLQKDGFPPHLHQDIGVTNYEKVGMEFLAASQNYDDSTKK